MEKEIIFSNYDMSAYEEMAKEDAESEGLTLSEDELYDTAWDMANYEWDEIFDSIKEKLMGKTVIFYGTVGRWDGTFEGGAIGEFEELWYKATKDCWYWELYYENGELNVRCSHHDGTNNFTIKVLTDEGVQYYNDWNYGAVDEELSDRRAHEKIIKNYTEDIKDIESIF